MTVGKPPSMAGKNQGFPLSQLIVYNFLVVVYDVNYQMSGEDALGGKKTREKCITNKYEDRANCCFKFNDMYGMMT